MYVNLSFLSVSLAFLLISLPAMSLSSLPLSIPLFSSPSKVQGQKSGPQGSQRSSEKKDPHCQWAQVHGNLPPPVHFLLSLWGFHLVSFVDLREKEGEREGGIHGDEQVTSVDLFLYL